MIKPVIVDPLMNPKLYEDSVAHTLGIPNKKLRVISKLVSTGARLADSINNFYQESNKPVLGRNGSAE